LLNGTFEWFDSYGENNLEEVEQGSASYGITEDLIAAGFESGRMKTGTPPSVDGRSRLF
jgi:tRNA uridine 5-carboxymethylaminomethyl modification enzyme